MRKPISTRTHGILDYLTVGAMLAFPRLLRCGEPFTTCLTGTALVKLGWVLLTRHELGVAKVLPMKAHLALDTIGGAAVAALPFAVEEDDPAAIGFCIGMGLTDVVVAGLTETTPSFDRPEPPPEFEEYDQRGHRLPQLTQGLPPQGESAHLARQLGAGVPAPPAHEH